MDEVRAREPVELLACEPRGRRDLAAALCRGLRVAVAGGGSEWETLEQAAGVRRLELDDVLRDGLDPTCEALVALGLGEGDAALESARRLREVAGGARLLIDLERAPPLGGLVAGAAARPAANGGHRHLLACIGFEPERLARVAAPRVELVEAGRLAALELANAELRRANARLARERIGTSGSGGASRLARVIALEDEIRRMQSSMSWRITAPLRWGMRLVRAVGRRVRRAARAVARRVLR